MEQPYRTTELKWMGHDWLIPGDTLQTGGVYNPDGVKVYGTAKNTAYLEIQEGKSVRMIKAEGGFGIHTIEVNTRLDMLDPNTIFGFYLYDVKTQFEVDFEILGENNPAELKRLTTTYHFENHSGYIQERYHMPTFGKYKIELHHLAKRTIVVVFGVQQNNPILTRLISQSWPAIPETATVRIAYVALNNKFMYTGVNAGPTKIFISNYSFVPVTTQGPK